MAIVTLTTDWGNKDHYLASFKGMLATHCPDVRLIDISNEVDHFNILQASFVLKNCFEKFPKGTVHFIGVVGNETRQRSSGYLVINSGGQYFVGYDSGVFSLVLDDRDIVIYNSGIDTRAPQYEINDRIIEIISTLANGIPAESFCKPEENIIRVSNPKPSFDNDSIKGSILYIDSFQNIISNISEPVFNKIGGTRKFSIFLRNHSYNFKRVMQQYADAETGEPVCLFNEKGLLELALNGSNAAGLLGVKVMDNIRIEFQGNDPSPRKEHILPSSLRALTEN